MVDLGFNSDQFRKLEGVIDSTYTEAVKAYETAWREIESAFAQFLFTPEGKNQHIPKLLQRTRERSKLMQKDFNNFIEQLNLAIVRWKNATNASIKKIDTKLPKENITSRGIVRAKDQNGNQGVNENIANDFIGKLPNINSQLQTQITSHKNSLEASLAFLGRDQDIAVENMFNKLLDGLSGYFEMVTNETNQIVQDTLSKYGQVAAQNVGSFDSTGFGAN